MTKKIKPVVGKYYLVSLNEILYSNRLCSISEETSYGKLLEISEEPQFKSNFLHQKYFIEFIKPFDGLHLGLGAMNVKCRKKHCYFVTINSIIKEVSESEILAKEL